jgi:hypothetical protein
MTRRNCHSRLSALEHVTGEAPENGAGSEHSVATLPRPIEARFLRDNRIPAHYELTLRLEPSNVASGRLRRDRESKAKLGVHLSGWGSIKSSKIWFDFPRGLLDPSNRGTYYSTVAREGSNIVYGKHRALPIDEIGLVVGPLNVLLGAVVGPNWGVMAPNILGERVNDFGFPIVVEFNISKTAVAGDHLIHAVLTYLTAGGWQGSTVSATIHVYTWAEKWQTLIAVLGLVSVIATVVGAILIVKPL